MTTPRRKFRLRITPSIIISMIALVVALSSSATAALVITGKNIKNNAVASKHIKPKAVKAKHIKPKAVKGKHLAPGVKKKLNNAGAPGVDGITGYEVVRGTPKNLVPNSWSADLVWCPSGKQAIAGGVSGNSIHSQVTSSQPVIHDDADPGPGYAPADGVADGWHGAVRNNHSAATTLTVYAICATVN